LNFQPFEASSFEGAEVRIVVASALKDRESPRILFQPILYCATIMPTSKHLRSRPSNLARHSALRNVIA
jgi:hypothetical protein